MKTLSAERAGFEPAVPFPVRQFSKLFLSATQAPLRLRNANIANQTTLQKYFKESPAFNFLSADFQFFYLF